MVFLFLPRLPAQLLPFPFGGKQHFPHFKSEDASLVLLILFSERMNFLMRSSHHVAAEQPSLPEIPAETHHISKPAATLEGLIAEDPYPQFSTIEERDGETDGVGGENGNAAGTGEIKESSTVAKHSDVSAEEGWITIPYSMALLL